MINEHLPLGADGRSIPRRFGLAAQGRKKGQVSWGGRSVEVAGQLRWPIGTVAEMAWLK